MEAVEKWPASGVQQEIRRCGALMPGAERMEFLGAGPGAVKGPVDAAAQAEDPDVSDELSKKPECCVQQPAQGSAEEHSKKAACPAPEIHEEETAIGLDQAHILVWFNILQR